MNTTQKGNRLEDELFDYLCDQKNKGTLVYGILPSQSCNIYKKREYYCKERQAPVEFDVVVELFRKGAEEPVLHVIFECKNHDGTIAERDVTDFSDKIHRIFKNAVKGVIVSSSRLQSGAENLAKSRRIGIARLVQGGLDIIAERKGQSCVESDFIRNQIVRTEVSVKPLKFSAYFNGKFFCSTDRFFSALASQSIHDGENSPTHTSLTVPFLPRQKIQRYVADLLETTGYSGGAVFLEKVCEVLSLDVDFSNSLTLGIDGQNILGHANFDLRTIKINLHGNRQRERFTLAHEIGHFYLRHDEYLRSESIIENDLIARSENNILFNYERLEYQANVFAACLLMPSDAFILKVEDLRHSLGISDKGHGFIFVDDQPCNYLPYNQLISCLQIDFDVSVQAIEINLKSMGCLVDQRSKFGERSANGSRRETKR